VSRITSCSCRSRASSTASARRGRGKISPRGFFDLWESQSLDFSLMILVVSEALEDLRTAQIRKRGANAVHIPTKKKVRNDIVHTDSCAFDPCISAADSLGLHDVTIVRCGFHEANYITTFARSISGSPLLATKARTITAICFLSFIFWADFGLLQCSAAPPQLKRFSPRMTRINANKEPRARILGRQIFNFCGLRSFTPVNSNSPGLVGHGVHFFRTLPPMRAAILKKIQQSQPPRW
jgi:hypothetical protein